MAPGQPSSPESLPRNVHRRKPLPPLHGSSDPAQTLPEAPSGPQMGANLAFSVLEVPGEAEYISP